jgi:hypothetical protein
MDLANGGYHPIRDRGQGRYRRAQSFGCRLRRRAEAVRRYPFARRDQTVVLPPEFGSAPAAILRFWKVAFSLGKRSRAILADSLSDREEIWLKAESI